MRVIGVTFCLLFWGHAVIAKKDPKDYTEADLERIYQEWEKDEEPLEPDELPEHLRPRLQHIEELDMSKFDIKNPDQILALSKKGQSVMTFVTVSGNPSRAETEDLTKIWHSSLYNAHFDVQRYVIEDNRAIFMYKDGSKAWEGKDFIIQQDRCQEVTIEGKSYPGKGSFQPKKEEL